MPPWLLKKPLFDFVISVTHSVLIIYSWNLQIRWTCVKPRTCLKTGQIGSLILELRPFDCWKSSDWLCHQPKSFSFDQIFLKLADKVNVDEIQVKFKDWPNWIINLRGTSPWLLKKAPIWFCHQCKSFSLDRIFLKLAIRWTWIKSRSSSKTGQIGSLILELLPFDC